MEIILNYLESMFAQLPDTEEVRKAKGEMASMMEDKYTELKAEGRSENEAIGIVISEFGNIDELIKELDISAKPAERIQLQEKKTAPMRKISRQQGEEYLNNMALYSRKIAIGVMLCICSPILLVNSGVREGSNAIAISLVILFVMIAVAVVTFIVAGVSMSKYEYLQKEPFELEPGAKVIFERMQEEERSVFGRKIALGVCLIILGVIPVVVAGTVFGREEPAKLALAVSLLLLLVAAGVYKIITGGMPFECYNILLQKGEFAVERKNNKLIDKISAIYWPLITAIYLGYSFVTSDWGRSWIIWPVAGVLFGGIAAICTTFGKKEER